MRRVVVTGLGMVTPLACGVEPTWQRLCKGTAAQGASRPSTSPTCPPRSPARSRAATARTAPSIPTNGWSRRSSARSTISSSSRCAPRGRRSTMPAGSQLRYDDQIKTGVMIGSGIGGLTGIAETAIVLKERGPAAGVAVLHSGPLDQPCVRICLDRARPQGTQPRRGDGLLDRRARHWRRRDDLIALGDADVMVAGGAELPISRIGMAGFVACRALSTSFNDTPERASRPYDRDRDGFVMGEGAGIGRARGLRARQEPWRTNLCRARSAMDCPATRITSPPRPRTAMAPCAA